MNTKERNEARMKFVEQNLQEIAKILKDNNDTGWFHSTRGDHPVRRWVDSIRSAAGYGRGTDWRTIWYTFRRDYYKIIKNNINAKAEG